MEGKTIENINMEEKKSLFSIKINILRKNIENILWIIPPIRRLAKKFKHVYNKLLIRK
jgi:hypothetical protein